VPESKHLKGLKKLNPPSFTGWLHFEPICTSFFLSSIFFFEIGTETKKIQVLGAMFTFKKYFISEGRMRISGIELM
jgi:hypothetical protein